MMKTRRTAMTPAEILVVNSIIGVAILLVLGIVNVFVKYPRHSPVGRTRATLHPVSPGRSSDGPAGGIPSSGRPRAFRPRTHVDTSGYSGVLSTLEPWSDNASLQEVAACWERPARNAFARLDKDLNAASTTGKWPAVAMLTSLKAMLFNSEGEPKRSYEALQEVRAMVERMDRLAPDFLYMIIYLQGVAAMRRGENENCIECRGESSCILPIAPAAVHTNPTGSRLAIQHFTEYLEQFPDDLEVRWLLNLAHMTLGEHPDRVNPRFLISLDRFQHSEFDIGKFRDIGHLVGVNRFNQAGGAIMEDFDHDGLLDIVATSFDPTMPMAYYRNKGDGTFEDRSKEAGLTGELGGLVCYQADYNNDGCLDIYVSRGAWLPLPIRPSLLRNNGDGTFTDVTNEAGLLAPANSNSTSWADYDNDGWLDLFVCCESQPNRLYHNQRDGTFLEVSARAGLVHKAQPLLFCKGSAWVDIDNDDYPDLFLNNLDGSSELYCNDRNGTFTNGTVEMGIDGPRYGFSCWGWDYDNDGWLDIFATCYDRTLGDVVLGLLGQPHARQSNRLFHNVNGRYFKNVTKEAGLDMVFATMGSNFGDFDNDGFLDMYLATGEPNLATLIPNRMFKNVGGQRFA
jgi:hypothetical protein